MNSTERCHEGALHLVHEQALDELDDVVHGIAFDGSRLVVAAGYRLVRIAPGSGRIIDQFETFPDRGGLAFDGRHLWQESEGKIQELDPRTGYVLRSLAPGLGEIAGLECIGDDLLVLHAGGRRLARVDTLDAVSLAHAEFDVPLRGLAWVARALWSCAAGALHRIDLASKRTVARFALPPAIEVCDLAGDPSGHFWCVDGRSRIVRSLTPESAQAPRA
jgi:hypothetical protein